MYKYSGNNFPAVINDLFIPTSIHTHNTRSIQVQQLVVLDISGVIKDMEQDINNHSPECCLPTFKYCVRDYLLSLN